MKENENIEFKEDFTENIYKEIVAFLNTCGGVIYIGYNDNGELIGLSNGKDIEEKLSNAIPKRISPDPSIFVRVENASLDNKEYIIIKVNKGNDLYYLTDKGILKSIYVRIGSCSIPASNETIKRMIIKNNNISFELSPSINEDLTFNYAKSIFLENNIDISDKTILKNLHLINNDKYTNLALLFSDQNPFTIKVGVYPSINKVSFLDRKEFTGSILKIYDDALNYLKINSATYGIIEKTVREDIEEYPEFVLREILLNSLIHRNYSVITSNIINIYKDYGIEFINYGSLCESVTIEDILHGMSITRNPHLQSIFMRIKRVEAIGSGLRRISKFYEDLNLKLKIEALPQSFIVSTPCITLSIVSSIDNDEKLIINYLNENGIITRKETEKLIKKEKTTTVSILNKLVESNKIKKVGNGPGTKYLLL